MITKDHIHENYEILGESKITGENILGQVVEQTEQLCRCIDCRNIFRRIKKR